MKHKKKTKQTFHITFWLLFKLVTLILKVLYLQDLTWYCLIYVYIHWNRMHGITRYILSNWLSHLWCQFLLNKWQNCIWISLIPSFTEFVISSLFIVRHLCPIVLWNFKSTTYSTNSHEKMKTDVISRYMYFHELSQPLPYDDSVVNIFSVNLF